MNRLIKFRGRDINGKMRFGHYTTTGGYPYIIEDHTWCEVEPDSVAQLVGYDKNNDEVYEGDEIVAKNGTTWVAVLNATVTLPEFANRSREPLAVNGFKLKEV